MNKLVFNVISAPDVEMAKLHAFGKKIAKAINAALSDMKAGKELQEGELMFGERSYSVVMTLNLKAQHKAKIPKKEGSR